MNKRIFASELGGVLWKILRFFILVGLSYVLLYPVFYMVSMAIRTADQVTDPSVIWIPKYLTTEQFVNSFSLMDYMNSFGTTAIVSIVSSALQLISCSMVGYGFARYKFKGSGIMFTLVLMTLIVPAPVITIPLYFLYQSFSIPIISPILSLVFNTNMPAWLTADLRDSWFVFWLPALTATGIRSGLYIFIFRQFFKAIPREMEEAAWVDGASHFQTFHTVMVPNASGAYLTVFLFSIVWYWNDTYYTNYFISEKRTLAKALSKLSGQLDSTGQDVFSVTPGLMAGALLFIIPLLILYCFLQKYFVESIERTGLVG